MGPSRHESIGLKVQDSDCMLKDGLSPPFPAFDTALIALSRLHLDRNYVAKAVVSSAQRRLVQLIGRLGSGFRVWVLWLWRQHCRALPCID